MCGSCVPGSDWALGIQACRIEAAGYREEAFACNRVVSIEGIIFQTFHKLGAAAIGANGGAVETLRADVEKARADLIKTVAESQR